MAGRLIEQTALEGTFAKRKPQEALLSNMHLPLRAVFYPLGYAVEIITNDAVVLETANETFGHVHRSRASVPLKVCIGTSQGSSAECPPEPTRRQYDHLYSLVANAGNQALLDLERCIGFAWLEKSTVHHRIYFRYNFLEKMVYLLLGASHVTDLHAACVSKHGKGILLCGDSGAGKSTLSYACARAGWTYTSDDTSYLVNDSAEPRVIGHSHRARFRPNARTLFPELASRKLTPRLEGKPSVEVAVSELPGLVTATEAQIHAVVYLNRCKAERARLLPLPKGTATRRACDELYSAGEIRARHEQILHVLSCVPTYELQYYDLDHAITELDRLTE
ncbi:MAG: HPr(Ser) kinase/phosphatase [Acidobacteriaceae bacterium]|nr:HPr(Ser) kinase/phosphatase [Acidobacteriaceae bacterium]